MNKKILTFAIFLLTVTMIHPTSASAVLVNGGDWNYGSNNNPLNWGAFSSYYHGSRRHWASVSSLEGGASSLKYANANATAYAFIRTKLGEKVTFNYGF